jgi:hypothetical protein
VGEFADDVNAYLCDGLAERLPDLGWETEFRVAGTPVDVAGRSPDHLVLVELEWRRADPADNAAKLFRHLVEGSLSYPRIDAFQLFTGYYDLASGGVSSKRENAEFVGRTAADSVPGLAYRPLDFGLTPPKRGGERPDGWREAADEAVERIVSSL